MAKFDKAALTRWDALVKNQQAKLEQVSTIGLEESQRATDRLAISSVSLAFTP